MDNCFIKPADIKVVPYFKTNEDLAKSICWELNSYLKRKDFTGNQPLQGPTFLVFRPSGRAGDEFKDTVTPHLKEGSPQYLIIASSTKPTDTFGISDDDEKRLQRHKTRIVINQGSLVASPENYHDYNNDSLKKLAVAICKDYSDCVSMRPVSRKPSVSSVLLKSTGIVFVITILYNLKKCLKDRAREMRPVSRKLSVCSIRLGCMVVDLSLRILYKLKKCLASVYRDLAHCITNLLWYPWNVYENYFNV